MNVPGDGGRTSTPLTGELVTLLAREHQSVLVVASPADNARQAFIPATEALRSAGAGPTVVVSPHLHALDCANAAARRQGLTTSMISSRNRESGDDAYAALAARKVDILLITEKRLANAEFERLALPHLLTSGLLVVDEAETISRSHRGFAHGYGQAVHRLLDQAPGAAVLALSGSGTYEAVSDLNAILGPASITVRRPILDTSLSLAVVNDLAPAARIAWATDAVEAAGGPAIVYARDQREAELLSELLASRGNIVYVQDPRGEATPTAEETPPDVVVTHAPGFAAPEAWSAFTTVVRTRPPMSLTSYHDQLTRRGSLAPDATATILVAPDAERRRRRPEPSTGRVNEVAVEVLMELRAADVPRNAEWLEDATNASLDLVGLALRRLRDGGAVANEGKLWRATGSSWSAPVETERPAKAYWSDDIKRYLAGDGCLMELIAAALGESGPGPCGRCTTGAKSAPQPGPRRTRRHS